jgi:hypothetical protein
MKTFVVLAVSTVLVSILVCPMLTASPSIPDDVQIVQPDPSLPKELSAFWGKWEGTNSMTNANYFLIVEKIDEEKASVYLWTQSPLAAYGYTGWQRYEAKVIKERGKYTIWGSSRVGNTELMLRGEYLDVNMGPGVGSARCRRVR